MEAVHVFKTHNQKINTLIQENIRSGNIDVLVNFLKRNDNAQTKKTIVKIIKKNFGKNSKEVFDLASSMSVREEPVARELSCSLITNHYKKHKEKVKAILLRLANDKDWRVRESAAFAFARVLERNFEETYPLFQKWVKHSSANVRRTVAVAAQKVGKLRKTEYGEKLLKLLEPLLLDDTPYVRKNLGPFAIGDGLLRYYPELTMKYIKEWSSSDDAATLWNVAMVFSTWEGSKHADEALPILGTLAKDNRRFVWRAVAAALRNLGRRKPEIVIPELEKWVKDLNRKHVAEVALQLIGKPF